MSHGVRNSQRRYRHYWWQWKQHFNIFSLASGLFGKDTKFQTTIFLHVAGLEALEVYNTFAWEDNDSKTKVDKIIEKFGQFFGHLFKGSILEAAKRLVKFINWAVARVKWCTQSEPLAYKLLLLSSFKSCSYKCIKLHFGSSISTCNEHNYAL